LIDLLAADPNTHAAAPDGSVGPLVPRLTHGKGLRWIFANVRFIKSSIRIHLTALLDKASALVLLFFKLYLLDFNLLSHCLDLLHPF
jgi:hypothetical protein